MSIETAQIFPDSVEATHWTCPKAPGAGMTHHLLGPSNTCRYCAVSRPELETRHRDILKNRGYTFDAQTEAAVESIIVYAADTTIVGVAWLDDAGEWTLGAPRTGRSVKVRSKERVERLLAKYAKHYRVTGRHGI